jgi:hypothetical protein
LVVKREIDADLEQLLLAAFLRIVGQVGQHHDIGMLSERVDRFSTAPSMGYWRCISVRKSP